VGRHSGSGRRHSRWRLSDRVLAVRALQIAAVSLVIAAGQLSVEIAGLIEAPGPQISVTAPEGGLPQKITIMGSTAFTPAAAELLRKFPDVAGPEVTVVLGPS
jgi:hypothetical protein